MKWLIVFLFAGALYSETLTLSLEKSESIALSHNKEIKTLESLLRKAEMGRLGAASKWLPQVVAMQDAFFSSGEQFFVNDKQGFIAQVGITQSVFESDVYYGIKLAELNVIHLRLLLLAAKNDILFRTRAYYYKLVLDYNTLATRKEHVDLMTSLAGQMRDNFERGTAKLYSVNQARVAAANATTKYYEALKQIRVDGDKLLKILGYDPGSQVIALTTETIPIEGIPLLDKKIAHVEKIFAEFEPEGVIYERGFPKTQFIEMRELFTDSEIRRWERLALREQPNILQRQNQVDIACEMVRKGYGAYLPSLNVVGGFGGFQSPWSMRPSTHFSNQNFLYNVGVRFQWTLFDGFGRESAIAGAKAKRSASVFELQKEQQDTLALVREQIFSIENGISQFITAEGNVRLSRQTIYQAKEQLQIGYMTIFDYQIAVDSYIEAENIRNNARYMLILAYYGLRQASGIDMEFPHE